VEIDLVKIKVSDLIEGYADSAESGVSAYSGRLDVRPKYQREFVYKGKQRESVIDTVQKGFPLNSIYWVKNATDKYEVLDGQQRIISICQYVTGAFSLNNKFYENLTAHEKGVIDNYELMVYVCEGNDYERLQWFKTINIAGEKLTDQELRNATYPGPWLNDAKSKFSRKNCSAWIEGKDFVKGAVNRQEFLETAIKWVTEDTIEGYMARNQNKPDASPLWLHYKKVLDWAKATFGDSEKEGESYRKEMKGLDWGRLYREYGDKELDAPALRSQVDELMRNDNNEIGSLPGIYEYVLSGNEKHLNLRQYDESEKRAMYEQQEGICPLCTGEFKIDKMEGDHITPWSEGGKTTLENGQMLCRDCNRRKGAK